MKIKYFPDTDTALLEFSDKIIFETRELSEDMFLDLDEKGKPVNITLEHASQIADLPDVAYQQIKSAK